MFQYIASFFLVVHASAVPTLNTLPHDIKKLIAHLINTKEEPFVAVIKEYDKKKEVKKELYATSAEWKHQTNTALTWGTLKAKASNKQEKVSGRIGEYYYADIYTTPNLIISIGNWKPGSDDEMRVYKVQVSHSKKSAEEKIGWEVIKDIEFLYWSRLALRNYGISNDGKYLITTPDIPWTANIIAIDIEANDEWIAKALKESKHSLMGMIVRNAFLKNLTEYISVQKTPKYLSAYPLSDKDDREGFCLLPDKVKRYLLANHIVKKVKTAPAAADKDVLKA